MINNHYTLGIDIGSTTVKVALLDAEKQLVFADYKRHFANIKETLTDFVFIAFTSCLLIRQILYHYLSKRIFLQGFFYKPKSASAAVGFVFLQSILCISCFGL